MKRFKITIAWIFCALLGNAQESMNASGGNSKGSGGSLSYSIGQVLYTTSYSNSGSVAQGVQHAYDITMVGTDHTEIGTSFIVYPNPVSEELIIREDEYGSEGIGYNLYDAEGRILIRGHITGEETRVEMRNLSSGTYFLTMVNGKNKNLQSYKIIKK